MKNFMKFIEFCTGEKMEKWRIKALKAALKEFKHKNKQSKNNKTLKGNKIKGETCYVFYIEEMEPPK